MKSSTDVYTIAHVKRLAKKIKKEKQIPHHLALDQAAKEAGFVNWKHFLNTNSRSTPFRTVATKGSARSSTVAFTIFPAGKVTRPNARMPIEAHRQVATLLEEVLASTELRKSVQKPIDSIRCELDDWVQNEYPSRTELSDKDFHELYYANRRKIQRKRTISEEEANRFLGHLDSVKTLLSKHYCECPPLIRMIAKIDRAAAALERWIGKSATGNEMSKQIRRGVVIRVKPFQCDAVVIEHDISRGTVRHYSDSGVGVCVRNEVSVYRNQSNANRKPMRLHLPYGKWSCADGSEVLFNRDYKPMWAKLKTGEITSLHPNTWVTFERQSWYYEADTNPPWSDKKSLEKCMAVLREWGVTNKIPGTLAGYHELLKTGIERKAENSKPEHQFPVTQR